VLCLALPALVAALVLAPAPQRALADAEDVLLASRNASGEQGNDDSHNSDISADGRFVAFHSRATNLVPGVTSGTNHVFRKDLQTGEVALVSCDAEGVEADAWSGSPSISADGRYVAFQSNATNLVPGLSGSDQIFRKDLETGGVTLASCNKSGTPGDGDSYMPDITPDGRFVAFWGDSTNLSATATSGNQVFRKDLETGGVVLCSANASGEPAESNAPAPSISADGRFVAFYSSATNLVPGGTFDWEVFRKDLKTKEIALVSSDALGDEGNATSSSPAMTPDGRFVSFQSYATNLVSPATGDQQVFRKELLAPTTFYFAEGYTGAGFQEYLCLGQPVNAPLDVVVTFMFRDGTTQEESYAVPALSRLTVDVNAVVGAGREVSVKCQAEYPFITERPMYFDYASAGGHWTGGHDVVGASSTSLSWYFAEGYTGPGFDEWICVLNPGGETADLTRLPDPGGGREGGEGALRARPFARLLPGQRHAGRRHLLHLAQAGVIPAGGGGEAHVLLLQRHRGIGLDRGPLRRGRPVPGHTVLLRGGHHADGLRGVAHPAEPGRLRDHRQGHLHDEDR